MSVVPAQPRRSSAAPDAIISGSPSGGALLALDLGTTTGFALRGADGAITSGTAEFRLDRWQSGGMRFLRFKHWLTEIKHQAGGIDLVVYEQVRRHAGVDAAHAFGGWLAILTAWCDHHGIAYGAVLVSAIVLVGFAVMLWLVIREEVPANQRDMVTLLLGTLAGMASSVVAYWVGSSNGSMQKNAALEKALAQK